MADRGGYRTYRGKSSKGKVFLAGILVLVILAAVAVLLVQEYIVYDKTGAPRLEVPWEETAQESEETSVEVDLVIRPLETSEPLQGRLIPTGPLTGEICRAALGGSGNAVAVTLKDSAGTVYCEFPSAAYNPVSLAEDSAGALQTLLESGRHTVARIACFHDPKAAVGDVDGMGLKNTGGFVFYDGNNSQWLDPAKPAARQYLCQLAQEGAQMGFSEILLTDVNYPSEGGLEKIAYGEGSLSGHLQSFLKEMREALEPYQVKLSMEVPAEVITLGEDASAGLVLADIAPLVDRLYADVLPEETEPCAAAVHAISEKTGFVPMLGESDMPLSDDFLIR